MSQNKTSTIKTIGKAAISLMLVVGLCVLLLAFVNNLTKDRIKKRQDDIAFGAQRKVINADTFEKETLNLGDEQIIYNIAKSKDGEIVGYVFTTITVGKSAGLKVMTGFDNTGVITGVEVINEEESPGYVDNVTEGGLLEKFKDIASAADANNVDIVSQATLTSNGIKDGVKKAFEYFESMKEGE